MEQFIELEEAIMDFFDIDKCKIYQKIIELKFFVEKAT